LAIVKPATEKTRSDGAEVAGIHSTRRASFEIILYFPIQLMMVIIIIPPLLFCHRPQYYI
jgi:hypothetical protein